ncbi:MAG: sugar phosphate isomerase/epimerase [Terriglobales bacterium]|jgi:sugar phosphate isomerase/epimerase
MVNRREFLQWSMAASTGLAVRGMLASERGNGGRNDTGRRDPEWKGINIGVQLYTVRKQAERDLPAVLEAIRKIGYTEVETYWNVYSHPAAELRRMISDHGLKVPSGHFNYEGLEAKIEYAKTLGVEYVICPMLPKGMWFTLDGYKRAAEQFNIWGEKIQQAGMQFGFHNHNYEFRRFGETTGWEAMMKLADPKLVCMEMDCYWITQAGRDPLQVFEEYGKRIRLVHLKDRKPGFPASQVKDKAAEHFTEVGAGTIQWKEILAAAARDDVKHYFVERDSGDRPAMESLRISFENLQKIG